MKEDKIAVAIYNCETKEVINQVDFDVPNIFNIFDVCDICDEQTKCANCLVNVLQMEKYFI